MESGLLTVILLAILSTCYTNGLTLNDLYPYGTEHGDTMRTGDKLPKTSLLAPIANLARFGPAGHTATEYQVSHRGYLTFENNDGSKALNLDLLIKVLGEYSNTKVYGRATDDPVSLKRAMDQINEGFPNTFCSGSSPTQLIVATWIDYLKDDSNPGSNFQTIAVTNGRITFGIVLYVTVSVTSADNTGLDSDSSFFPFGTDVINAPTMMLNSTIPGTYIFSMNHTPPDPCTEPPDCSAVCKVKLLKMACEAMRMNGKNLPAPCNN